MQLPTSAKQGGKNVYTSKTDLSPSHTDAVTVCFAPVALCLHCPALGGAPGVAWVQTHPAKHICAPRRAVLRLGGCPSSPAPWELREAEFVCLLCQIIAAHETHRAPQLWERTNISASKSIQ